MDKNYILILGWVAVMAILSMLTSVKRVETVCGKKNIDGDRGGQLWFIYH